MSYTFGHAYDRYLDRLENRVESGIRAENARRDNERLLDRLIDREFVYNGASMTLRDVPIIDITQGMIFSLLEEYASTPTRFGRLPSPNAIRNMKNVLGSVLTPEFAKIEDRQAPQLGIDLKLLHGRRSTSALRAKRNLPIEQWPTLLGNLTETWKPITTTILHTGLRSAEARGLRLSDLDLDSDTPGLRVNGQATENGGFTDRAKTENSTGRFVPIFQPEFAEYLRQHVRLLSGDDYLFATDSGKPQSKSNFWRAISKASGKDGLPELSVHDLRHACAHRWLRIGIPLNAISKALGHASVDITAKVYLSAPLDDDAMFDAFLNPSGVEFTINEERDAA